MLLFTIEVDRVMALSLKQNHCNSGTFLISASLECASMVSLCSYAWFWLRVSKCVSRLNQPSVDKYVWTCVSAQKALRAIIVVMHTLTVTHTDIHINLPELRKRHPGEPQKAIKSASQKSTFTELPISACHSHHSAHHSTYSKSHFTTTPTAWQPAKCLAASSQHP